MKKNKSFFFLLLTSILIIAIALAAYTPLKNNLQLGLDLRGGVHVMLQGQGKGTEPVSKEDMLKVQEVMRKRVDALGVSEPTIQIVGQDRIIVEIAGVKDPNEAVNLIGKTAELKFISGDSEDKEPFLTGAHLKKASTEKNTQTNEYVIALEFDDEGKSIFGEETLRLSTIYPEGDPKRVISIYLDDELITNPRVNEAITDGKAIISGGFKTFEDAANVTKLLNAGSLPVSLEIIEKSTVGPSLGADSLNKSVNAILIGLSLLVVFLILLYRLPGVITTLSLIGFSVLLLSAMVLINVTLTLPGIAAIILSVAIAADANIIIICRFQDEIRKGKSLASSLSTGYKKAFTTILDTNMTSVFAGLILLFLGTGPIKGFAVTLLIGIVINMITSLILTKYMLIWAVDTPFLSKKGLYGFRLSKGGSTNESN